MKYIDGFLIPVPKKNIDAYKAISKKAGKVWKEYGALEYRECMSNDIDVKGMASFSKAAKAKEGDVVVFSWIAYKSKAHRDKVNKKVMADPRLMAMCDPKNTPFDVKKMCYGGFEVVVDL